MPDPKSMFSFEFLKFFEKDFITIVFIQDQGSSFVLEASFHFQFPHDSEVIPSMINFS